MGAMGTTRGASDAGAGAFACVPVRVHLHERNGQLRLLVCGGALGMMGPACASPL
jgi:hypothetical protein